VHAHTKLYKKGHETFMLGGEFTQEIHEATPVHSEKCNGCLTLGCLPGV